MKDAFDSALAYVLKWEGGYSNHPRDPGGATNYGVTQKTLADWRDAPVTAEDVRQIKMSEVRAIYQNLYWTVAACDDWPPGVDFIVFDSAVNQGPKRAVQFLQRAVGVTDDGSVGPITREAVRGRGDYRRLLRDFSAYRALHYAALPHLPEFGLGWMRRLLETHETAMMLLG